MLQPGRPFQPINRIAILLLTAVLTGYGVWAAIELLRAQDVMPFNLFQAIVSPIVGLGFGWAALRVRHVSDSHVAAELSELGRLPETSASALHYRFSFRGQRQAICVDPETNRVHFYNCLVPRQLFATPLAIHGCSITDIKAVFVTRYRREALTIATGAGRAFIPRLGAEYVGIRDLILKQVPSNEVRYEVDNPLIGLVVLFGMVAGAVTGLAALPRRAGDGLLLLMAVGGSLLGAAASFAITKRAAAKGIGIVTPIAFLVLGAVIGISIMNLLGRDAPPAGPTIGGCTFAGFLIGGVLQVRRQRRNRHEG